MRLSKIKLAGFKSFVDPTTFHLPSNLVGIVGPNGCGKSNVIDAVRWVMGEMSAKHLRGDSMADVIFNGSASRNPVGTASIELFFDNSDGAIGGPYAQYGEISLRRIVARDGTSTYFLNNTKCRRKDITDLFLGTGLGSRSYAIIEQGMVSRLVEAKPDEMRSYIEEAAGISRYKERRRETENRIQHTRDNLARLNDLREEISKQIESLQRQAKAAERYKDLKSRERRLEAELLAIRLTDIERHRETCQAELLRGQTQLESATADQRRIEAEIVSARERHVAATEAFNQMQARHYSVQSEISRLEQGMAHAREIRDRQQDELNRANEQYALLDAEYLRDEARREELQTTLAELEPAMAAARKAEASAGHSFDQAEEALKEWQRNWHEFNLGLKELQQTAEVEQTKVQHLDAQLTQLRRQQETLEREHQGIVRDDVDNRLSVQADIERKTEERATSLKARLQALDQEADELRQHERQVGSELEEVTADLSSCRGQLSALHAVQEAALGSEDRVLAGWLAQQRLDREQRLVQRLRVEDRWVLAVETVLGDFLNAVCVKGFAHHLSDLPAAQFTLVERNPANAERDSGTLLGHVSEPGHAAHLLASVHTAENLADAVQLQGRLPLHKSVITPDGIWLGPGWVRVNRGQRSAAGLLTREHKLRDLHVSITGHETRIAQIEANRESTRARLNEIAALRVQVAHDFDMANREHAEALAVLDNLRQAAARSHERRQVLERETARIVEDAHRLSAALTEATTCSQRAVAQMERLNRRQTDLEREQEKLLRAHGAARAAIERDRAAVARIGIEFETRRVAWESADSGLGRLRTQRTQLQERLSQLAQQIAEAEPAIAATRAELSAQLEEQIQVDRLLAGSRADVEQVEAGLRESEGQRSAGASVVATSREAVDTLRMQVREYDIRRESLLENLAANGASLEEVRDELPGDANASLWQEKIDEVRRKLERLGPVNLAAIEQFDEQSERKKYLDAQNEDLTAALDTLEQAIRKIDRDTRSRFQETFDNINQGLKRIFPRLFGGGHAYLSLEGEDILAAGVTVMARPPGKRNSHIHLLSGGEKALTAVALIFSIFELNPAPFCLLDEVDAPLDEANVGRFCDIVREMAERVQFVVITHNKTTMELVNQLTGVTMNEPGVSRLVSVDLDAAVQLAAS
jgi:chromosome segregation protein